MSGKNARVACTEIFYVKVNSITPLYYVMHDVMSRLIDAMEVSITRAPTTLLHFKFITLNHRLGLWRLLRT